MLLTRKSSLTAVPSNHDRIESVSVFRLFWSGMLPSLPSGRITHVTLAVLQPAPQGQFSQHHHGFDAELSDRETCMDGFFFVVEGSIKFKVEGVELELEPGDLLLVQKGEIHSAINLSAIKPATYLCCGISNGGRTTIVKKGY